MKKKRSLRTVAAFDFLPIAIIHICFLPLWFNKNISFMTKLTSIEMGFSIILLPLYLLIFNFIYSVKSKQVNFLPNIGLMLLAAILGNCLYYFNWGISSGNLFSPDSETIYLFQSVLKINSISIVTLSIIWQIILRFISKPAPK